MAKLLEMMYIGAASILLSDFKTVDEGYGAPCSIAVNVKRTKFGLL